MKKLLSLALITSAILLSTNAQAGLYFGAGYGSSDVGIKIDGVSYNPNQEDNAYSAYVGYSINLVLVPTIKVEFAYANNQYELQDFYKGESDNYMVNGYIGIPLPLPVISPYVGVGLGSTSVEFSNAVGISKETGSTYAAMFGIDVDIPMFPIKPSIEVKYSKTSDIKFDEGTIDETSVDYTNTSVYAKLRYAF